MAERIERLVDSIKAPRKTAAIAMTANHPGTGGSPSPRPLLCGSGSSFTMRR